MKPVDVRRAEALTRNTAWAALSPEQQLQRLDALGLAAKQQRARLSAQLSRRGTQSIPVADVARLKEALLSDVPAKAELPKPEKKPRHKKGKRGDGRHA